MSQSYEEMNQESSVKRERGRVIARASQIRTSARAETKSQPVLAFKEEEEPPQAHVRLTQAAPLLKALTLSLTFALTKVLAALS